MRIRAGSSDVCSSDLVFAMSTRAVRDGDDWVITGAKQWITNSPSANLAMVFAVTDPERVRARRGGVTGFLVDTDRKNVVQGKWVTCRLATDGRRLIKNIN